MKQKTIVYLITIMLLGMMFFEPMTIAQGSGTPIYQSQDVKKTFNPATVGNKSYYIVPTTDNPVSGVTYSSSIGGTLSTTTQGINGYASPYSQSYFPNQVLSSSFTTTNPNYYNNFFLSDSVPVPNAVQIDNNQTSLTVTQTTPFSLHNNETLSVFSQQSKTYYAAFQHTGNFVLDFAVQDSSAHLTFSVYSGKTSIASNIYVSSKLTYPIFSNAENFVVVFSVSSSDSIVTITPHELTNDYFHAQNLAVNTTAQFTVNQGACFSTTKQGDQTGTDNLYSNINVFNFPIQTNNYYEIYINEQDNYQSGCTSQGPLYYQLLNETASNGNSVTSTTVVQKVSGNLGPNGYQFKAIQSGNISLLIDAFYYMNENVTVFFRQITQPQPQYYTVPIKLNKAVSLPINTYNSFTIDQPSMIAINNTYGYNLGLEFYWYNSSSGLWIDMGYFSQIYRSTSNNLIGDGFSSSYNYWYYIPAGTYAVINYNSASALKFTFNVLQISTLNGATSKTVPITNSSLYAFELTQTNFNYNTFNLSTNTLNNITINYEYAIESKYNEIVNANSGSQSIGNLYTGFQDTYNGGGNDSIIYNELKFTDVNIPIILVHPSSATNSSNLHSTLTSYSTTLTVKTGILSTGFLPSPYNNEYMESTPVTSQISVDISATNFPNTYPIYYMIPLTTTTNSLYNLTIYTQGNMSSTLSTSSQNLTINYFNVYGGKFDYLNTGFQNIIKNTYNTSLQSIIILTQSSTSYLYLNLLRNILAGHRTNGTVVISLTKITAPTLSFNGLLQNYGFTSITWNSTVSPYEFFDKTPLLALHYYGKPKASPGFEVVMAVMAVATLPLIKKLKKKNRPE